MSDELKVTLGPKEFSGRTTDEKLDLIYKAVTSQQNMCMDTVGMFNRNCVKYDNFIEETTKKPRYDRKINLGLSAGTGAMGGYSIPGIIEFIKNLFSGAN